MCFAISKGTCVWDEFILGGRLWGKLPRKEAVNPELLPAPPPTPCWFWMKTCSVHPAGLKGAEGLWMGRAGGKRGGEPGQWCGQRPHRSSTASSPNTCEQL